MLYKQQLSLFVTHAVATREFDATYGDIETMNIFAHRTHDHRRYFGITWYKDDESYLIEWGKTGTCHDRITIARYTNKETAIENIKTFIDDKLTEDYCRDFMQHIASEKYPIL